jgi:hypothetical protein
MATIASLNVFLRAKTGHFNKGMKRSARNVNAFSGTIKIASRAMSAFGVALGTAGAVVGMKKLISAASDAQEITSKFETVFKDQAKAAEEWGNSTAKAVGRSTIELKNFLASMQDTFVPLGFARKQARLMSQQLVKLAIDLASFNNTADPDTLRDLQSAIVGNHETMRKYGVIITQTVLDQQLLSMGFQKVSKGATEQQKAIARLQLILKSTTDAQGDAERTAGSFANQLKALKSAVFDAAAAVGDTLLPLITSFTTKLRLAVPKMKQMAKAIVDWTIKSKDAVSTTLKWGAALAGLSFGVKVLKAINTQLFIMKLHIKAIGFFSFVANTKGARVLRTVLENVVKILIKLAAIFGIVSSVAVGALTVVVAWAITLNKELSKGKAAFEGYENALNSLQKAFILSQEAQNFLGKPAEGLEKTQEAIEKVKEQITSLREEAERQEAKFGFVDKFLGIGQAETAAQVARDLRHKAKLLENELAILERLEKTRSRGVEREIQRAAFRKLEAERQAELLKKQKEWWEKIISASQEIFEQTRTPIEKYEAQLSKLNDLLNLGVITWDTYGRAIRMAMKELQGPQGRATGPGEFRTFRRGLIDVAGLGSLGARDPKLTAAQQTNVLLGEQLNIMRRDTADLN